MFEQSAVESRTHHVSGRRAATLPVSMALHAVAVSGALFVAVWQVEFPRNPPAQIETLERYLAPPEPEPARGGPRRPVAKPVVAANQNVAPTIVPEKPADQVDVSPAATAVADPGDTIEGGSSTGEEGGSSDGVAGGFGSSAEPPQEIRRVGGDVLKPVIVHRVEPLYPPLAVKMRLQGIAVVECIIDRYGNVQSVKTIHATHDLFRSAAEDAVARWKFRPGTLNGQAIDVIFNLTVQFKLNS